MIDSSPSFATMQQCYRGFGRSFRLRLQAPFSTLQHSSGCSSLSQEAVNHANTIDTRNVKQGSDAWHKLRQNRLTSSCFAAALGFWGSRKLVQLWEEKIGVREQFSGNHATEWGLRHEYFAIDRYQEATGNTVYSLGFKIYKEGDDLQDWIGASPDGLIDKGAHGVYENGGILEVKCPYNNGNPENCMPWISIPFYYMPQVQGLMEIVDRNWLDMYVWTLNGSCIFRVERDAQYWTLIFSVLSDFWWANVVPAKHILLSQANANPSNVKMYQPAGLHRLTSIVIGESKNVAKNASLIWKGPPTILGRISRTEEASHPLDDRANISEISSAC